MPARPAFVGNHAPRNARSSCGPTPRAKAQGADDRLILHVETRPQFNAGFRQLLHVSFKLAAKAGTRYTDLLKKHADIIGRNVTENLYDRHMRPLFLA